MAYLEGLYKPKQDAYVQGLFTPPTPGPPAYMPPVALVPINPRGGGNSPSQNSAYGTAGNGPLSTTKRFRDRMELDDWVVLQNRT